MICTGLAAREGREGVDSVLQQEQRNRCKILDEEAESDIPGVESGIQTDDIHSERQVQNVPFRGPQHEPSIGAASYCCTG